MGLKTGESPSKYFNKKNKQASPLRDDSPFKQFGGGDSAPGGGGGGGFSDFMNNGGWQYSSLYYDEDGNWVPPADNPQDDTQGAPDVLYPGTVSITGAAVNPNQENAAGNYIDTWQYDSDGDGNMDGFGGVDPYFSLGNDADGDGVMDQDLPWEPDCTGLTGDELQQCLAWHAAYGGDNDGGPGGGGGGGGMGGNMIGPSSYGGITPSLDPNAETAVGRANREREESGAHRYARGGQTQNPDIPVYPWADDIDNTGDDIDVINYDADGDGYVDSEFITPDRDPIDEPIIYDQDGDGVAEIVPDRDIEPTPIDYDPDGDGIANVVPDRGPSTRPNQNVSYISDRPNNVSPANTRPGSQTSPANTRPGPPETSPAISRPDTLVSPPVEVETDIFGNVVSATDTRGRNNPFTTVKTPKQFKFKPRRGNNNKRGFIQPRWT